MPPIITGVDLSDFGFVSIGQLGTLIRNDLPDYEQLASCGLYAITTPSDYTPDFIDPNEAAICRNVINPAEIPYLQKKWVEGTEVIYIGLAGRRNPRTLRKRLRDLLQHGKGKTTESGPHKGGEILWQLVGSEEFELWILATEDPPYPRVLENRMLMVFETETGKLPFANRQH